MRVDEDQGGVVTIGFMLIYGGIVFLLTLLYVLGSP